MPLPAVSISRLLKAAVPLPALEPMSRVVVPCNGPVPEVSDKVRDEVEGKPAVELFPNASWLLTTGCVPKAEPAVALAGCVTNAKALTLAGLTTITVEVVLTRLPLLNKIVILVATRCCRVA